MDSECFSLMWRLGARSSGRGAVLTKWKETYLSDEIGRVNDWYAVLTSGDQEARMDVLGEVGREAARQICARKHGTEEGAVGAPGLLSAELRDAVLENLTDENPEVRAEAALAAAAWNDEATATALEALLGEGEDEGVRQAAAQSISVVHSASASQKLLSIAEDEQSSSALREQALASFAAIGVRESAIEPPSIAFGPARTRGRTRGGIQSVEQRLAAIEGKKDVSPYVRFLAGRARSGLREAKGV